MFLDLILLLIGLLLFIFPVLVIIVFGFLIGRYFYKKYDTTSEIRHLVIGGALLLALLVLLLSYIFGAGFWNGYKGFAKTFVDYESVVTQPAPTAPTTDDPAAPITDNPESAAPADNPAPATPAELPPLDSAPAGDIPEVREAQRNWENVCWPEDVTKAYNSTGGVGYREYLISQSKPDGTSYRIARSVFKAVTDEAKGYFIFEGRLPEVGDADHTDIFYINVNLAEDFVYREGSFYFATREACDTTDALKVGLDRLMFQKWQSRFENNELANLSGFSMTGRMSESDETGWYFDEAKPYAQITSANLLAHNTCDNYREPRRTDYFGDQKGDFKNFYFGAPFCRSMAIGEFQADTIFPAGFAIRLYDGAMDNQTVKTDGRVQSYLFPTSWSGSRIEDWLKTNFSGVDILDPEGVLE
jgi:hypothetical protein